MWPSTVHGSGVRASQVERRASASGGRGVRPKRRWNADYGGPPYARKDDAAVREGGDAVQGDGQILVRNGVLHTS